MFPQFSSLYSYGQEENVISTMTKCANQVKGCVVQTSEVFWEPSTPSANLQECSLPAVKGNSCLVKVELHWIHSESWAGQRSNCCIKVNITIYPYKCANRKDSRQNRTFLDTPNKERKCLFFPCILRFLVMPFQKTVYPLMSFLCSPCPF